MVLIGRTNRNWLFVAALGGLTLAAATTQALGQQVEKRPEAEQNAAAPKPSGASKALAPSIVTPPESKAVPATQKSGDKRGVELGTWPDWVIMIFTAFLAWLSWRQHLLERRLAAETSDALDIARKSADAAEKGATAAVAAARATRRLVGATTESAQAAHAAVRVSELANAAMLRPYVYIIGETIGVATFFAGGTIVGDHVPVGLSIKNFGQTPAKRVRLMVRAFIGETWAAGELVNLDEAITIHRTDLPPGFERGIEGCGVDGMAEPYARILLGECTVFFEGLIEYEDASGTKYETRFRRACTGQNILTGVFTITPDGNEAT